MGPGHVLRLEGISDLVRAGDIEIGTPFYEIVDELVSSDVGLVRHIEVYSQSREQVFHGPEILAEEYDRILTGKQKGGDRRDTHQ